MHRSPTVWVAIALAALMALAACGEPPEKPSDPDVRTAVAGDDGVTLEMKDPEGNGIKLSGDEYSFPKGTQLSAKLAGQRPGSLEGFPSYIVSDDVQAYEFQITSRPENNNTDLGEGVRVEITGDLDERARQNVIMAASAGPDGRILNTVEARRISGKEVYSYETGYSGKQQIVFLDPAALGNEIVRQAQTTPDAGITPDCPSPLPDYSVKESGTLVDRGETLHPCLRRYRDGVGVELWSDNSTPLIADPRSGYDDYSAHSWNTDIDSPTKSRFTALDTVADNISGVSVPIQPGSLVDVDYRGRPPAQILMRFSPTLGLNWGIQNELAQLIRSMFPTVSVDEIVRSTLTAKNNESCYRDDIRWGATDYPVRLTWLKDRLACIVDAMPGAQSAMSNARGRGFDGVLTQISYQLDDIAAQVYPAVRRWADPRADDTYVLSIDSR